MSLLQPIYRATLYASKTQDATEATVLAPVSGAPHSDLFKVATREGVSGFKAYMSMPSGRRGRLDLLSKKTDIGELSFDVQDQRLAAGGSNAQRWVTAFVGDLRGLVRFKRLKCFIEESLYGLLYGTGANGSYTAIDATTWTTGSEVGRIAEFLNAAGALVLSATITASTATTLTFTGNATGALFVRVWAPFFTGRVRTFGLKSGSRIAYTLTLRDMAEDLTYGIFTGRPHGNVYQTTERIVAGAQTSTTLKDTTQVWAVNQWAGAQVTITKGTGVGQRRTVTSNTVDTLAVAAWAVTPDATSFYSFGYAQLVSVTPVGFIYPYGGVDAGGRPLVAPTKALDGKIAQIDATNGWAKLTLDRTVSAWIENFLTSTLFAGVAPTTVVSLGGGTGPDVSLTLPPQFTGRAIARLVRKDTGAEGDFQVGFIVHETVNNLFMAIQIVKSSIVGIAIRPVSYPLGVATGTPLVNGLQAAAPTAMTSAVVTDGWTISTTGILKQGDILSFAGHLQRYVVVSDANSNGSGQSTITLKPGLQAAVADNEAITVQVSPARMAIPPLNTLVRFSITCDIPLSDGGDSQPVLDSRGRDTGAKHFTPGNILLVNDVHPAQFLKDVLNGWYGRLYTPTYNSSSQPYLSLPPGRNISDPWRAIPVMNTDPAGDGRHGFNALLADGTFPSFRCIIDKQMPINEFIEQYICQPYGIGYYFDGNGVFVPVDMRQPPDTVAGIVTVTDADLKDDIAPSWSFDASQALAEGKYTVYAEGIVQPIAVKIQVGDVLPAITTKMFDVASYDVYDTALGDPDISQKQYQIDAHGFRAMPNEVGFRWQNGANVALQSRWTMIQQAIADSANKSVKRPFGNGVSVVTFTAVRNSNTANLFPGSFFVWNVLANVDSVTNTRGQPRLCIITERSEDKAIVKFTAVDWGLNSRAANPTLATPANLAGDTSHSQTCVITLNAQNEWAEVWVNVTTTAIGARPADSDPNWMFVGWASVSGWTVTVRGMPTGMRVWWRARTNPARDTLVVDQSIGALRIPSAWRYPSSTGGTDFADLSTMSAPTALVGTGILATQFTINWTPGDVNRVVEIWLATPVGEARQKIATLSPGSTRYFIGGLTASTTYRVAVREIDTLGGFGEATTDIVTTSTAVVVQPPLNIHGKRLML